MLKRNIKFPIVLQSGNQVRTIEELKENFEIETIIRYFSDGRLFTWLEQRYYIKELHSLQDVNKDSLTVPLDIANIFGIDIEEIEFNYQHYKEERAKIEVLNKYTSNPDIINNSEYVALSQSELDMLIEKITEPNRTIYLLNDATEIFNISDQYSNINYVGINNPTVSLMGNRTFDAKGKNIVFKNVRLTAIQETKINSSVNSTFDYDNTKIRNNFTISKLEKSIQIDGNKLRNKSNQKRSFETIEKIHIFNNVLMVEIENEIAIYEISTNNLLSHYSTYEFENSVKTIKDGNNAYCLDIEILNHKDMGAISYYKLLTLDSQQPMKRPMVNFRPMLHFRDMRVELIGVHDDILYLYSVGLGVIQSCQVNLNDGSLKKGKRIEYRDPTYEQSPITYHFNNGKLYYFVPFQTKLMELNNEKEIITIPGTIGHFEIRHDKLFALRSHPRDGRGATKEYMGKYGQGMYKACSDSLVKLGEFTVIDMVSGNEIRKVKAHEDEIDVLKIYDDVVLTYSSFAAEVKFWDIETLELLSEIEVPLLDSNKPFKFDVDLHGDQLAVLVQDKVYIYS
ncbi:hypothetical protein ASD24_01545 [Paenibacillus sp. Root52]|uniref:hypothetical protein n=1 Tax=Paenibacillus sp. Root52 TaxID=1736552 RepID=UPI0007015F48|nr:hypothetical protein [Paenibacillus sp. Root52]KQY94273.1 hypothetical protein ASD24_01545 [Paenibacillus sp. Root52]